MLLAFARVCRLWSVAELQRDKTQNRVVTPRHLMLWTGWFNPVSCPWWLQPRKFLSWS